MNQQLRAGLPGPGADPRAPRSTPPFPPAVRCPSLQDARVSESAPHSPGSAGPPPPAAHPQYPGGRGRSWLLTAGEIEARAASRLREEPCPRAPSAPVAPAAPPPPPGPAAAAALTTLRARRAEAGAGRGRARSEAARGRDRREGSGPGARKTRRLRGPGRAHWEGRAGPGSGSAAAAAAAPQTGRRGGGRANCACATRAPSSLATLAAPAPGGVSPAGPGRAARAPGPHPQPPASCSPSPPRLAPAPAVQGPCPSSRTPAAFSNSSAQPRAGSACAPSSGGGAGLGPAGQRRSCIRTAPPGPRDSNSGVPERRGAGTTWQLPAARGDPPSAADPELPRPFLRHVYPELRPGETSLLVGDAQRCKAWERKGGRPASRVEPALICTSARIWNGFMNRPHCGAVFSWEGASLLPSLESRRCSVVSEGWHWLCTKISSPPQQLLASSPRRAQGTCPWKQSCSHAWAKAHEAPRTTKGYSTERHTVREAHGFPSIPLTPHTHLHDQL
nr:translation initiation factor IF-2-like [Pongo pygmaeus]